jgi:hypothetical protein
MAKLPKQMSAAIGTQKELNKLMGFGSKSKKQKASSGARTRRKKP